MWIVIRTILFLLTFHISFSLHHLLSFFPFHYPSLILSLPSLFKKIFPSLHLLLSFSICTFWALNYRRKFKENQNRTLSVWYCHFPISLSLSLSLSDFLLSVSCPVSPIQRIGIFLSSPSHFSRPSHQDTCYFPLFLSLCLPLFLSLTLSWKPVKIDPWKGGENPARTFCFMPPFILRTHSSFLTLSLFIFPYPSLLFLAFDPFSLKHGSDVDSEEVFDFKRQEGRDLPFESMLTGRDQ